MLPQINQEQQTNEFNEKDADTFAATLAFTAKLQEQLMPKAEQPQTQEMGDTSDPPQQSGEEPAPQEKVDLEANNKEMEKVMNSKLEDLRKEIKETIKEELSGIKDSIKEALEDGEE